MGSRDDDFIIQQYKNIASGYNHDICVKCSFKPSIYGTELYDITKTQGYMVRLYTAGSLNCANAL